MRTDLTLLCNARAYYSVIRSMDETKEEDRIPGHEATRADLVRGLNAILVELQVNADERELEAGDNE